MTDYFSSLESLVSQAEKQGCSLSQLTWEYQATDMKTSREELFANMAGRLAVMRTSGEKGLEETRSPSGLSGGQGKRLREHVPQLLGPVGHDAAVIAMAIAEHNACMGRIVAAPTAGACGILPGVLLSLGKHLGKTDEQLILGLFNAAAVGLVIAKNASLSGAEGGCAAECGSAGAMAASAAVELLGGTPRMCANACAFALKAVMGLVCDPVAGLVEVPCIKRNVSGAMIALSSAELALAGIESAIPADEVILAMKSVGCMMNPALRETSLGGIAATPTACEIARRLDRKQVQASSNRPQ